MYQMLIFVVNDLSKCADLLEAWDRAGAKGVTCIATTGLGHMRRATEVGDLPFYPSLIDLLRAREHHHRTFFTVVDDESLLEKLIQAAQDAVGGLDAPNTGILFTVPVNNVYGIAKRPPQEEG